MTSNNETYMLVRGNTEKKDSLHYGEVGLRDALQLQSHLFRHRHERTQLFTIDVERGTCSLVTAVRHSSDGVEDVD